MSDAIEDAIKSAMMLAKGGIAPVEFTDIPLRPKKPMLVSYAKDEIKGDLVKLIFHFKHVSIKDMQDIGKLMWEIVNQSNVSPSQASGSPSPIFKNQWDFIWMDIPSLRAAMLQKQILQKLLDYYAE